MRLIIPGFALYASSLLFLILGGCSQTKTTSASTNPPSAIYSLSSPGPARPSVSGTLAAGTTIETQLGEVLDSDTVFDTSFMIATVVDDVKGSDGSLAVPAHAPALLVVREAAKNRNISRLVLGLNRIEIAGKIFRISEGAKDMATLVLEEDAGNGPSHRSIHRSKGSRVTFRLESPVQSH